MITVAAYWLKRYASDCIYIVVTRFFPLFLFAVVEHVVFCRCWFSSLISLLACLLFPFEVLLVHLRAILRFQLIWQFFFYTLVCFYVPLFLSLSLSLVLSLNNSNDNIHLYKSLDRTNYYLLCSIRYDNFYWIALGYSALHKYLWLNCFLFANNITTYYLYAHTDIHIHARKHTDQEWRIFQY